jgi:hypothetical protein
MAEDISKASRQAEDISKASRKKKRGNLASRAEAEGISDAICVAVHTAQ